VLVDLLGRVCPTAFIVDFSRIGIGPGPPVKNGLDDRLFGNTEIENVVSPRLLRATDNRQREVWINAGWGSDAVIVLFTLVEPLRLREHYQALMGSPGSEKDAHKGILELGWPSSLITMLTSGKSEFVTEIVDPCEAILLERPDAPGGWSLFGDRRMTQILTSCLIPHTYELKS
jgi:hypothetical protein